MSELKTQLADVCRQLLNSNMTVVFTGAGISTESGIPDFRSPGGIWSKQAPVMFDDFLSSSDARQRYWQQKSAAHREYADAKPNVGHITIAKWERSELVHGVITQNIDGLHQVAGSKRVLELHGTARKVACVRCSYSIDADPMVNEFHATGQVPSCPRCQAPLKHATISFGQQLSVNVLSEASTWCKDADLVLAMGSSLVVTPAADLPRLASENGAALVILNRDETALDHLADHVIRGKIGETLESLDRLLGGTID